jgi:hypothetical protein
MEAQYDLPEEGKGCFAGLEETTSPMCVFGDKAATRTAVLIGDSHANQWLTPLARNATRAGWRLVEVTKAGCPVAALPVWQQDLDREYTECSDFQEFRATQLARLKPDLVIASQANAIANQRYEAEEWARGTISTLNDLAGKTAKVAFIGDSTYGGDEQLACLENNLANIQKCVYSRYVDEQQRFAYDALATQTLASHMGFVDTGPFFCNSGGVCPPVVDNMLTHRDNGHITNTYAKWLAPMLAPIFRNGEK